MSEHHAYDHSIPVWGWILITIAIAMFAGLLVHVVVDHGKNAPVPRVSSAVPVTMPALGLDEGTPVRLLA